MQVLQMLCLFQWKINTKNASIAFLYWWHFLFMEVLWGHSFAYILEISTLRYCITKHSYKK